MFYIFNGSAYFYNQEQDKTYPVEVEDGEIHVSTDLPMKKHKDINCFYNLDEILVFGEGLKPKKEKKSK